MDLFSGKRASDDDDLEQIKFLKITFCFCNACSPVTKNISRCFQCQLWGLILKLINVTNIAPTEYMLGPGIILTLVK